jgi:predicted DNA-binding transcriptional regulator AlpA
MRFLERLFPKKTTCGFLRRYGELYLHCASASRKPFCLGESRRGYAEPIAQSGASQMKNEARGEAQKKLLSEKEVELSYGLNRRTLQGKRVKGGGPKFIKFGRLVFYRPEDIEEFLRSRTVEHTSQAAK